MNNHKILTTAIFDLGGTLIEYAGPYATWPDLETPGFTAAYHHLSQNGHLLPSFEEFKSTGFALLPVRWQGAAAGLKNLRLVDLLADVLAEYDITTIPSNQLTEASEMYQTAICSQAALITGAQDVLSQVKTAGFKIGLVSNTMFTGAAHKADLARFALLDYFDTTIFSADVNKWKPNPDPFWHVLEALDSTPDAAVYIGDDPRSDILGGQRAGMRTIHFQSSQRFAEPDGLKPDARIHNLAELMPILSQWAGKQFV